MGRFCDIQVLCEGFDLNESCSEVDGIHVLAKVTGPFFVPDGISRNKRFYSRNLWERAISNKDIKEKFKNRTLLGTISHEVPYDDKTLQEGNFSHVVTDAYINEKNEGICEALILGTPAGKILNTMLRAGCKLYVSSRADGGFTNESHMGVPVVDPDSFMLEGWDWVLHPGFLQASPHLSEKLYESLKEEYKYMGWEKLAALPQDVPDTSINTKKVNEETKMSLDNNDKLIETLTRETTESRGKMNEALQENANLRTELLVIREENKKLTEEVQDVRSVYKKIGMYESFGEPEDVQAAFDAAKEVKDSLDAANKKLSAIETELGSAEEIRAALSAAEEVVDQLSAMEANLGSAEEIEAALDLAREYKEEVSAVEAELGSAEEIREALKKSTKVIEAYRALGTPREIKEALNIAAKLINDKKLEKLSARAAVIANDLKLSEKKNAVFNMLRKGMTEKEIRESFTAVIDKYKIAPKSPLKENVDSTKASFMDRSRLGESLMDEFSGRTR